MWFSPRTLVSSTNKTDPHDIADILLKVALKTIKKQQQKPIYITSENFIKFDRAEDINCVRICPDPYA